MSDTEKNKWSVDITKDFYINESMLKRMSMQLITKDGEVIETDIDTEHIKENKQ